MDSARLQREAKPRDSQESRTQKPTLRFATASQASLTGFYADPVMQLATSQRSLPYVQAKLSINQPGDQYEQEADRVAEQVVRMPEPAIRLQRSETAPQSASDTSAPAIVHEVLKSPGKPLNKETRARMEPRFGQDFSNVRVHADEQAAQSAAAVNAKAYTVGQHIVFGQRQYAPESSAGQHLIAHELTRVTQQSTDATPKLQKQTRRQIARDNELRQMALRPSQALQAWRRLREGERTVVVTYMTMFYSLEFAQHFLRTASRSRRPETIVHVTNASDLNAAELTRRGYRFLTATVALVRMEIWVHSNGNEVWWIRSGGTSEPAPTPPVSPPQETGDLPEHINVPADPVAVYGPITASRENATFFGASGRVVRYADGTVEFYAAGSSGRHTYRPQPGGENSYYFYDESGNRTTLIGIDFNFEVFGNRTP